jgi:hypothetical protein
LLEERFLKISRLSFYLRKIGEKKIKFKVNQRNDKNWNRNEKKKENKISKES